jgi:TetR/AcrR family transcriptional repressor of mexJK operon
LRRIELNGIVSHVRPCPHGGAGLEGAAVSDAIAAPKRGPKCAQVLEGARKVFMDRGYEGASVDEIARAAGTSKATLYSYFPDKRQLFEAVMQAECGRTGEVLPTGPADEPLEAALRRMARGFSAFLFSPGAQEMFRVCIAEAGRFPELGAAFHATGPAQAHARLAGFFEAARDRGELAVDDPATAAEQFAALCKAGLFLRALLGGPPPVPAEVERVADEAVRTFLARYGKADSS